MNRQKSRQMFIKEAAVYFGVVERTIERRIKKGELNASKVNGRWVVEVVIDTDRTPPPSSVQSNQPPTIEELKQLRSEVKHLRELLARRDTQIDQLNHLLAMQTQQNTELTAKLPDPRPRLTQRLRPLLVQLRLARTE